ncbi:nucleoside phosphorylase [Inquilinus ginsengisoli]|uniref:Nucleoside phosphorylase n=1 Tax=Inquilinus ginsengisoli TaxID=363840 RepID=A0ABU1JKD7_9PROT|nr:hypothetical protein [Inquilinus ginsengisoli]MDR6289068.1 nucleoside phosphorylase [Inquilinus ginsengisoli]
MNEKIGDLMGESLSKRQYFDIVVIIPLEEEVEEFTKLFNLENDYSKREIFRYSVECDDSQIKILMVQQEDMGKTHARNALSCALEEFDIGIVICLGIGGCLSDDLKLGDVCYSNKIFDVLDNAKASDVDGGKLNIEFSPTHYATDRVLVAAINFIRQKKNLRPLYEQWQKEREVFANLLVPEPVVGRNAREEKIGAPRAKDGTIACASVTKSEEYNKKLKRIDRKVLVVETESGGIYEAARSKSVPAITIRGISDHADDFKNELEAGTSGNIRKIAASNAASFLKLQIKNPEFLEFLNNRRRVVVDGSEGITTGMPKNKRSKSQIISDASIAIDEKLRELCPDFRLQPRGYRLPVPRVRHIERHNAMGEAARGNPINLDEALEAHSAILLRLPRTYPDHSLPWVIADDLLTTEIGGNQALPVVIDGAFLKAPSAGFRALSSHSVEDVEQTDGIQVIYIVDNIPVSSKSRFAFLKKEISVVSNAKFIFITREDSQLLEITDFANEQKAATFELCSISFYEITHFIQKNFSMSGSEAEVVALRLQDTFEQFDLSAHPTYFAGIPKEVLSALLQANRRSELIQLAVDGFLTFLVADDRSDITLSRTTRSRFLRKLVIETNVEKRNFSQADLIGFTKEFSELFDFAINPMKFIQSFVDQGILHFDASDNARFSLPFIESYLLASELSQKPEIAISYFDFSSQDFDYATFDLYSEIGASDEVVGRYLAHLQKSIDKVLIPEGQKHILLADRIHPPMLDNPSRMQALQRRLHKAIDDVQNNRGDTKEKQKVIDVAEHVKEVATKQVQADFKKSDDVESKLDISDILDEVAQSWTIGVVLLGCGAEHLTADVKQDLSKKLVILGSSIIHHWTEIRVSVDFKELKERLLDEENIKKMGIMVGGKGENINDIRRLIGLVSDVMHYNLLSEPFRRVTDYLCENARHRVLATSVEKAKFDNPMEQILHSAWLTDIESRRGKKALYEAIRRLPASRFLRMNLATHFLTRVHWNHWRKEDRLILLDAAEQAIKPLSAKIDKGELKRAIEKTPTQTSPSQRIEDSGSESV